jgi:hypothetical protein
MNSCAFAPLGARKGRTAAGGVGEGRRPPFLFVFVRALPVCEGAGAGAGKMYL